METNILFMSIRCKLHFDSNLLVHVSVVQAGFQQPFDLLKLDSGIDMIFIKLPCKGSFCRTAQAVVVRLERSYGGETY